MKTGILTDPYGNIIGGGHSAPAIDANHLYVYDCSEVSGSTVLKNTGSGVNGDLTLQGTEGVHYLLNQKTIGRNTRSFRNLVYGGTGTGAGGAVSGSSCSVASGSITVEIFYIVDNSQQQLAGGGQSGGSLELTGTLGDIVSFAHSFNTNNPYAGLVVNSVGAFNVAPAFLLTTNGCSSYLAMTYDGNISQTIFYVNGINLGQTTAGGAAPLGTLNTIRIGTTSAFGTEAGWFTQARISNIVRSPTYIRQTHETLLSM